MNKYVEFYCRWEIYWLIQRQLRATHAWNIFWIGGNIRLLLDWLRWSLTRWWFCWCRLSKRWRLLSVRNSLFVLFIIRFLFLLVWCLRLLRTSTTSPSSTWRWRWRRWCLRWWFRLRSSFALTSIHHRFRFCVEICSFRRRIVFFRCRQRYTTITNDVSW